MREGLGTGGVFIENADQFNGIHFAIDAGMVAAKFTATGNGYTS